jgi:hypothetical protein
LSENIADLHLDKFNSRYSDCNSIVTGCAS